MIPTLKSQPNEIVVACTIEVSNTFESLHAHVQLPDDVLIEPGDEVTVQGEPIVVPYGSTLRLERMAKVRRAGRLERTWTRLTGDLEFMELCEFSFSSGSKL